MVSEELGKERWTKLLRFPTSLILSLYKVTIAIY